MHDWGYWGWNGVGTPFLWGPFIGLFALLALWSLFWKGLALWHAARRGEPWWFVVMLILNTAGLLEIVYLFFFARLRLNELFTMGRHTHHDHHSH